jgi:hypothetical protein
MTLDMNKPPFCKITVRVGIVRSFFQTLMGIRSLVKEKPFILLIEGLSKREKTRKTKGE